MPINKPTYFYYKLIIQPKSEGLSHWEMQSSPSQTCVMKDYRCLWLSFISNLLGAQGRRVVSLNRSWFWFCSTGSARRRVVEQFTNSVRGGISILREEYATVARKKSPTRSTATHYSAKLIWKKRNIFCSSRNSSFSLATISRYCWCKFPVGIHFKLPKLATI